MSGLEECPGIAEPSDIPCRITSTWNYTPPCEDYNATVWQEGINIINYTFGNYSVSGLCNFTFNITETGSYYFQVNNGDTGNIIVEAEQMMLALVVGVGIIAALFLWLAFKLETDHFLMKLLLILTSISMMMLIPLSIFIPKNLGQTFYRSFLYFFVAFWIYVGTYFVYWLIKRMNTTVQE